MLESHNPTNHELAQLKKAGFNVLISFLQEREQTPRYDIAYAQELGYQRYNFPVRDFTPPTIEQLEQFIDLFDQSAADAKMILHCEGGIGRTGTFAAAYWVAKGMTAGAAVQRIRQVQPHAVETVEQLEMLEKYAQSSRL